MESESKIINLKARLTDLGQQHAAIIGQQQQCAAAAAQIERECLKVQGVLEFLLAEAEADKASAKQPPQTLEKQCEIVDDSEGGNGDQMDEILPRAPMTPSRTVEL